MEGPRCGMICDILYTGQCPPQDTSLEVSLPCSLNPSSARFLARSLHQPSLPQPFLPPLALSACLASSLPLPPLALSLPPSLPSPCYLPPPPSPCTLPPSSIRPPVLHPSSCSPSFPHPPSHPRILLPSSLLACLPPTFHLNVHRVCVFATLHCIVQRLVMHDTNTMGIHSNTRHCYSGALTAGVV